VSTLLNESTQLILNRTHTFMALLAPTFWRRQFSLPFVQNCWRMTSLNELSHWHICKAWFICSDRNIYDRFNLVTYIKDINGLSIPSHKPAVCLLGRENFRHYVYSVHWSRLVQCLEELRSKFRKVP
jgi:hypothetical protein